MLERIDDILIFVHIDVGSHFRILLDFLQELVVVFIFAVFQVSLLFGTLFLHGLVIVFALFLFLKMLQFPNS